MGAYASSSVHRLEEVHRRGKARMRHRLPLVSTGIRIINQVFGECMRCELELLSVSGRARIIPIKKLVRARDAHSLDLTLTVEGSIRKYLFLLDEVGRNRLIDFIHSERGPELHVLLVTRVINAGGGFAGLERDLFDAGVLPFNQEIAYALLLGAPPQ